MNSRQLKRLGITDSRVRQIALRLIAPALHAGLTKGDIRRAIEAVIDGPAEHVDDTHFGELARALLPATHPDATFKPLEPRPTPAPWRQFGEDLDPKSIEQMEKACQLPISVAGALMPDAHLGYGLPIGGVLATDNAVIPYAVGVDIACRMKLTVLDLPTDMLTKQRDVLTGAIETQTRFGIGAQFKGKRREHPVMDEDWNITPVTSQLKDKAHGQLGTSGSGNHFVEFGVLTIEQEHADLSPGTYLALMSHSGSRGAGARVCDHYSKLAQQQHPQLPRELQDLAWLDLESEEGCEYWAAMELMGRYAAANHELIHSHIVRHLKAQVLLDVENHHNFAWREQHEIDGEVRQVIVHRKGATPAGADVLGVIPGSMATPAYLVAGRGCSASLNSASHGAGRAMSRTQAKKTYRWSAVEDYLKRRQVEVISAGIDEVPFAYKDIDVVMSQQQELVRTLAKFEPRLVKMAPAGERPED